MPQAIELEAEVTALTVQALQAGLGERLAAVVLFGSRARGGHRPGSDWDVLVLADGLPSEPLDRYLLLKRLLPASVRSVVSLLAKTPAEFESNLPALYLDIALDGRILTDPRGYAADRLGAVRRLIRKAGLSRQRTAAGDVWRWRDPPQGAWSLEWES